MLLLRNLWARALMQTGGAVEAANGLVFSGKLEKNNIVPPDRKKCFLVFFFLKKNLFWQRAQQLRESALLFPDRHRCRDASDVTLTFARLRKCFKMWNPRFTLHAVLTYTDMYFTSSHSPPQVLPSSHILHCAAVPLSSSRPRKPSQTLFFPPSNEVLAHQMKHFFPNSLDLLCTSSICQRARRKHLVRWNGRSEEQTLFLLSALLRCLVFLLKNTTQFRSAPKFFAMLSSLYPEAFGVAYSLPAPWLFKRAKSES